MDERAEKNLKRIADMKLRETISNKNTVMESSLQQDMLELLRFDSLMSSMRFFDEHGNAAINNEYDKNLRDFILAYKGSSELVYGKGKEESGFENIVKQVKEKIVIGEGTYKDQKLIMDLMPETAKHFSALNDASADLLRCGEYIKEMNQSKRGRIEKAESDKEALEVLDKISKKYKEKDKSAQVSKFLHSGGMLAVELTSKKGKTIFFPNEALFKPLNNSDGLTRLNDELGRQNNNSANKAKKQEGNKTINAEIEKIEANITKAKKEIKKHQEELNKTIKDFFQALPASEFLGVFEQVGQRDFDLNQVLSNTGNINEVKKSLVETFRKENKLWNHVEDGKYYDMVKRVVRKGWQKSITGQPLNNNYKNSVLYKAFPQELKDLINIREIEIYGFDNPTKESLEEANKLMSEKHGYRISLTKVDVSKDEKPEEFKDKTNAETAQIVWNNALSSYQRGNKELGLLYSLGEGKKKNDEADLFRAYMDIYFDYKRNFTAIEAIELQKEYGWDEYKKVNDNVSSAVYKEISSNAENPDEFKEHLLRGMLIKGNTDHIFERRDAYVLSNPNEANNLTNLAKTIRWKAWQKDPHDMKNFFSLTTFDGINPYLTETNGKFERKTNTKGLKEVYTEKPQALKDGKWADLIPEETLLVTSNITIPRPKIPETAKHKTLDCFKKISILEEQKETSGKPAVKVRPLVPRQRQGVGIYAG